MIVTSFSLSKAHFCEGGTLNVVSLLTNKKVFVTFILRTVGRMIVTAFSLSKTHFCWERILNVFVFLTKKSFYNVRSLCSGAHGCRSIFRLIRCSHARAEL